MRPDQRHRRAAGPPGKEEPRRDRVGVPHLLRDHAARAGHPAHRLEIGQRVVAGLQLEMAALAGQQRPAAPDAGTVKGAAVLVFAIAVAAIAVPHRPHRRVGAQQRIGQFQRTLDQRVFRTAQPEADQLQEFGADLLVAAQPAVADPVADRHDRKCWRRPRRQCPAALPADNSRERRIAAPVRCRSRWSTPRSARSRNRPAPGPSRPRRRAAAPRRRPAPRCTRRA